jgi:hypothetical protein
MATWHQLKRPAPLFHKTLWTVVVDPPGDTRCLHTFANQRGALMFVRTLRTNQLQLAKHTFVLKPAILFEPKRVTTKKRGHVHRHHRGTPRAKVPDERSALS